MDNIKHIVYLMLENCSLDNVLGWLYEHDKPTHIIPPPRHHRESYFDGLQGKDLFNFSRGGRKVPVSKINVGAGQQIPSVDPHEKFAHVQKQISTIDGVTMGGFLADFVTSASSDPSEIMKSYTPESLPVIMTLKMVLLSQILRKKILTLQA